MVSQKISMPHPVLGIPDDMTGSFELDFQLRPDRPAREYEIFGIRTSITNDYIKQLHEGDCLDFVLKVSCPPTYKTWTFINQTLIRLPESEVDQILEVEGFLVVKNKINFFKDSSFNEIFSGASFDLDQGDIVALTGSKKILIEKENEKSSLGSIFRFSKIDPKDEDQEISFSFEDQQIVIYYPSKNPQYDPINLLFDQRQGLPYCALNMYIIPAIANALAACREQPKYYADKKWRLVLDKLLGEQSTDDDFINAQRVIHTDVPINLAFAEILKSKNL
jgi:hypothetical protein